jgi:protein-S-isoprenylcysteine O-methyltransferase Ste14
MTMKAKLVFFSIVSVLIQFALSILGWGGCSAFFAHPALIALAIATALLLVLSFFVGGNLSTGEQEDRGNRWVLIAFGVISLLMAYVPALTDRIGFWTIDGDATRWLGIVLLLGGGVLRLWPVLVLGNRFSGLVAIQPDHKLVTTGLYRVVRNPSYVGMLVTSLGWVLAFRSGVGVVIVACLLIPLVARMHAEERLLRAHFGSEYEEYFARTWRLFPGIY